MAHLLLRVMALLISLAMAGCAVVPEFEIETRPPKGATKDLASAMDYADSVSASFQKVQLWDSGLQAGLNLSTLTVATMGAARVVYQRPTEALRPIVVALAALGGLEYTLSPKTSRQILLQGSTALTCAKHVARAMDDLPVPIDGSATTPTPTVPASPLARLPQDLAAPVAPGATPGGVDDKLRAFADALIRSAPVIPAAPGSMQPIPPIAIMAANVEASAANQAQALNNTLVQAKAVRAKAPEYLVFATENIVHIVLNAIYKAEPSTSDVVSTVQKRSADSLKDFQAALTAAQKQTQTTMATLTAAKQVAGASTPATNPAPSNPGGNKPETPPTDPDKPSAPAKPGEKPTKPSTTPAATPPPSQTTTGNTNTAANNAAAAGQQATNAVQNVDNLLAMLKTLADAATQCSNQK